MKNLKKVLALVLVVVMALGLITVSNAAAFTDGAAITKTEAVEVLTAVGVIKGYEDGSFKPEGEVTRAEMAKMIAVIMNKGEDVGELYKNACKFVDSANHWAAGYIAYCTQSGIINGKSATVFDPDGKVTGTEAAKMILCALGYKADVEGYVGANWASAVLARAAEAHLVGKSYNLTANMAEPLNRENAAQILLNGLKADMVKYESTGVSVTTKEGVTINTGAGEAKAKTNKDEKYANIIREDGPGKEQTIQLGEEMFDDPALKLDPDAKNDAFGRPANRWEYDGKEVSLAPSAAALEYKDELLGSTLYADLGKVAFNQAEDGEVKEVTNGFDVEYYVNGKLAESQNKDKKLSANETIKQIYSASKGKIAKLGGVTEVYKTTTSPKKITIVHYDYFTATIANVYEKRLNTAGDLKKVAYVALETGVDTQAPEVDEGDKITSGNTFVTEAFTTADIGAHVIYTKAAIDGTDKYVLKSVEKADSVTGLFSAKTGADKNPESVVLAGTTYKTSANADFTVPTRNADAVAYLDPNGNVVAMEGVASNEYIYLLAKFSKADTYGTETTWGVALFADGTVKDIELVKGTTSDSNNFYKYTKDSKDVYTLTLMEDNVASAAKLDPVATYAENDTMPTGVKAQWFKNVSVNSATKFIVETIADGAAVYTTYEGIANLPSFATWNYKGTDAAAYKTDKKTNISGEAFAAGSAWAAVSTKNADDKLDPASVVFIFGAEIENKSSNVTALFLGNDAEVRDDTGTYYTVKAIVNGAETTVKILSTKYEDATGKMFITNSLTTDANGIITSKLEDHVSASTELVEGAFVYDSTNERYTGTYSKSVVDYGKGAVGVDASIPVYAYNIENATFNITTISAYAPTGDPGADDAVKVLIDTNTGDITAFYVLETNG